MFKYVLLILFVTNSALAFNLGDALEKLSEHEEKGKISLDNVVDGFKDKAHQEIDKISSKISDFEDKIGSEVDKVKGKIDKVTGKIEAKNTRRSRSKS